jgi:hypothetical protein
MARSLRIFLFAWLTLALAHADSRNQGFEDFVTPQPVKPGEVLVLGIVGGWERWDNPARCVRRTAIALKERGLPGVFVETVENHKLELAVNLVQRAFDFNSDGRLQEAEARRARLVVFGQSLGGRAVLLFAREMKARGIQVELAVLVDAIGKDTYLVPDNVRQAANVFQRDHLVLRGANQIRAADPARTNILFNRQVTYRGRAIDLSDEPWKHRVFMGGHIQLEYDLPLWLEIEELLARAAIAATRAPG